MLNSQVEAQLIMKVLRKYGEIELPAQGTSMYPLIKQGDICTFTSCKPTSLYKGDIALFISFNGKIVAHRFCRTEYINNKQYFLFKGDTNLGLDEPVYHEHIIGKLAYIQKRTKKIKATNFPLNSWSKMILTFPIISYWLRLYLNKKEAKTFSGVS